MSVAYVAVYEEGGNSTPTGTATATGQVTGIDGLCLGNENSLNTEGNPIGVSTCNGGAGQQWSPYTDSTVRVQGGCLDVEAAGKTSGTLVDWYPCNGTAAQDWTHESNNELVNTNSGLCLTDPGGNTSSRLDIETCAASAEQLWTLPTGSGANTVTVTTPPSQTSTVGTAVSLQVHASDSASGQTLTYTAAGLPAGLSVNSGSGLISGTPTTAGTSSVTVTAKDTTGASGSATFTWTVNPPGANTVTVTNPGTQTSTVGTAASLQIHASDSASGQTLTYTATGLPAGLSINSATGLISGTPTTAGTSNVTVTATDTTGASGPASFSWTVNASGSGEPPAAFWGDTSAIPAATHVLEVSVVNQTNGQYPDSEVYWSFNGQTESIAQQRYIDMPANSAGRMYFYLGTPNGPYYDFIEFTVGASSINVDTTRVDRFGLKLALLLHGHDGSNQEVGENYATFQESRAATFQRFENFVPTQFKELATDDAPYGIPSPGNDPAFQTGGAYANYFTSYAASVGDTSDSTAQIFGCGGTLAANPTLCAGLNRHVAQLPASEQSNPANFYQAAPANYYAEFWHQNAINGKQYGFPYDDDAGQSSDISVANPQYMVIAVGW
jgi:hypothetical protein